MDKKLALRLESVRYLRKKALIVLHMLKKLNRQHTVEGFGVELIGRDVSCDACQIFERRHVDLGQAVNMRFLRFAIGDSNDLGVWKALGEVNAERTPTTAISQSISTWRERFWRFVT